MRRQYVVLFLPFLLLLVTACSNSHISAYRKLEGFGDLENFRVDAAYDKAVSDTRAQTIFALRKASQEIHIYRGGSLINSVGGLGFERTNFQRLSDIGVDTDGGLLALDSAQKILRKFSPEGGVIADVQFTALRQPELFCQSGDGTLFIYDASSSELVCYSQLDNSELYRFGRFELEQPASIACNRDYLYAYSAVKDCTYVFFLLGQYKETLPGQVVFDNFNNPIRVQDVVPAYASAPPKLMQISDDSLVLLQSNEIRLLRLIYARGSDAAQ